MGIIITQNTTYSDQHSAWLTGLSWGCRLVGHLGTSMGQQLVYWKTPSATYIATPHKTILIELLQDDSDIISTEGCFSCQMNGGGGRRRGRYVRHWESILQCNHLVRKGRSKRSSPVEAFLNAIRVQENKRGKEEKKVVRLGLELTSGQTRHRKRVVRLQPSREDLRHEVDYEVWWSSLFNLHHMLHFYHILLYTLLVSSISYCVYLSLFPLREGSQN